MVALRADESKVEPFFLFYYLLEPQAKRDRQLASSNDDSPLQKRHRPANFSDPKVPPLPEQKAIAHILGTLDDKIELNRRMNATLEGMAQALFKSWFVDFDPVIDNALAAGNPIPDELAPAPKSARTPSPTAPPTVKPPKISLIPSNSLKISGFQRAGR